MASGGSVWAASVSNVLDTAIDPKEKIDQLLPGVPYIRKFGGSPSMPGWADKS